MSFQDLEAIRQPLEVVEGKNDGVVISYASIISLFHWCPPLGQGLDVDYTKWSTSGFSKHKQFKVILRTECSLHRVDVRNDGKVRDQGLKSRCLRIRLSYSGVHHARAKVIDHGFGDAIRSQ